MVSSKTKKSHDYICEGVEIWNLICMTFIRYLWKMEDEMKGKSPLGHIEIISGNNSNNNNYYFENSFEIIYQRKFGSGDMWEERYLKDSFINCFMSDYFPDTYKT